MPNFTYLSQHWDKYTYPWRPGKDFLNIIKKKIPKNSRVCILGSTIEFRSICKDIGCYTDLYDLSPEMLATTNIQNVKEQSIVQDWFKISGKKYDVILGDLILLMFPVNKQIELIKTLKHNLAENGYIYIRGAQKKKTQNIQQLETYIKNIGEVNIDILNYICFECVIGMGWNTSQIEKFFKELNTFMYEFFKKNYSNLVPYGNSITHEYSLLEDTSVMYSHDFYVSREYLIKISH